ncbi:S-methylmethionine permease [Klebsiella michiganensis]|uniref:S-methylmethionine permease n=1 Tax=Klebsiella michiganensis TaxID=1134687 RepID=A0A7H4N6H3_9ENTR|nr:S-methylmethionine permease [Klebsiella michiganensis]
MQTTQQQGGQLKRTMKTRHLIMLSLGGVIGTGLFFNTGYIISTTGAAGTLLAYLIGALVVWLVMQCLGELSVAMPETGAFSRLRRPLSRPGDRVHRRLALLAYLDRRAWLKLHRRRILHAVLVPAGAGMGLVRGVLRGDFRPQRYLHPLLCRR